MNGVVKKANIGVKQHGMGACTQSQVAESTVVSHDLGKYNWRKMCARKWRFQRHSGKERVEEKLVRDK